MLWLKAAPGTLQTAVVASLGVALGCQCIVASRRSVQHPACGGHLLPSQKQLRRDASALCGRWVLSVPLSHAPFSTGDAQEGAAPWGCFCEGPRHPHRLGNHICRRRGGCPGKARAAKGSKRKRQKWVEMERSFSGQGTEQQQVWTVEEDLCLQPKRLKHPWFQLALTLGMLPRAAASVDSLHITRGTVPDVQQVFTHFSFLPCAATTPGCCHRHPPAWCTPTPLTT